MADWGQAVASGLQLALQLWGQQAKRAEEHKQVGVDAENARKDMLEQILMNRAAQLGAPMTDIQAVKGMRDIQRQQFLQNRHINHEPYMTPEQLVQAYTSFSKAAKSNPTPDAGRYPQMTDSDWADAQRSKQEALAATSTPDFVGLYPEQDPDWIARHGGV